MCIPPCRCPCDSVMEGRENVLSSSLFSFTFTSFPRHTGNRSAVSTLFFNLVHFSSRVSTPRPPAADERLYGRKTCKMRRLKDCVLDNIFSYPLRFVPTPPFRPSGRAMRGCMVAWLHGSIVSIEFLDHAA